MNLQKNTNLRGFSGFTLVELIVVITILVILGTIAFINLGGFAGSARDSARISNLNSLKTGLDLVQIKSGTYPLPEGSVAIMASGVTIGFQGYAGEQVGSAAKLSPGATKDPLDPTMYITYSVNLAQTKMQAMVFLEDSSTTSAFNSPTQGLGVDIANASSTSDYSKRFPKTTGDSLGILLSNTGTTTLNQPIQETNTGVDVVTTTGSYTAYFTNKDTITGSGTKLVAMKSSMTSPSSLPTRDTSLVGYWDMETAVGSGLLADLSGNGNNGVINGTTSVSGKVGNARSFSTGSDVINYNGSLSSQITISVWIKAMSFDTGNYPFILSGTGGNIAFHGMGPVYGVNKGKIGFYINNTPGGGVNTSTILNLNQWYYVVVTHDSTTNKIYLNGILEGSSTYTSALNPTSFSKIGGAVGYSDMDHAWNGSIDEARIYNRALSDSEIQTLYNATK